MVTILVPVFGVERYIAECAESLFKQTYKNIEYVFCDDCTLDGSIDVLNAVLSEYPERVDNVRIIRNEMNLGLGGTRANLIKQVQTGLFMFVDSDDVLPFDAVEKLVRKMSETDTDIVEGAYSEMNSVGMTEASVNNPFHGSDKSYRRRILCQNVEPHQVWGKLYKASVLADLPNMFIRGIDNGEDFCATARLSALCTRSWTDDIVYCYRVDNAASYSNNVSEKNFNSFCAACNEVFAFYSERNDISVPLKIGMLNAYRLGRKASFSFEKINSLLQYNPSPRMSGILKKVFDWPSWKYCIADRIYRTVRFVVSI